MERTLMATAHPGFKAVQERIAAKKGISKMWAVYLSPEMLAELQKPPIPGLANGDKKLISQDLADEVALIAQKYTGYLYGHPTRAGQYGTGSQGKVFVDSTKPWNEPIVFPDGCEFCLKTLSDERVVNRVLGFQAAMDKEVTGGRGKEAFPLTDLPLHLKRRLCIEWNHAFQRYLVDKPYLYYDFEAREVKEVVKIDDRMALAANPEGE